MKTSNNSLAVLSHPQLLDRFKDLVCRDRRCTAEMLAVIAEVDQRKLWATHACPSMFTFCMERFHMSEAVTAKRIWAARTARRFPVIFDMVARGELHLGAIHQLARHLTDDNHRALLNRAKHKSSREIEKLVAEIAPQPDVASRIRALPRLSQGGMPSAARIVSERETRLFTEESTASRASERRDAETTSALTTGPASRAHCGNRSEATNALSTAPAQTTDVTLATESPAACGGGSKKKSVVALSPRRYKIEITVDQDTHDKLRMLEDLLSHQHANADPAVIVSQALELLLTETLKKKAAMTDRGRRKRDNGSTQRAATRQRAIPAAIRREVWRRDGGRCGFVDERGKRCSGTRAVEYHHIDPYGKGGGHEASNIALRCRAHNQHQADLDFGRGFMDRKREGRRPDSKNAQNT
jgi:5-methylcytosine-specific restriction endonuclease McrA